jgi:acetylornithine/succinyldiaminopimelate/putrescine aminotransferase
VRILPPLDVTEREIDLGVRLFAEAVEAASSGRGAA